MKGTAGSGNLGHGTAVPPPPPPPPLPPSSPPHLRKIMHIWVSDHAYRSISTGCPPVAAGSGTVTLEDGAPPTPPEMVGSPVRRHPPPTKTSNGDAVQLAPVCVLPLTLKSAIGAKAQISCDTLRYAAMLGIKCSVARRGHPRRHRAQRVVSKNKGQVQVMISMIVIGCDRLRSAVNAVATTAGRTWG